MLIGSLIGLIGLLFAVEKFYYKKDLELLKRCKEDLDSINRIKLNPKYYIMTGEEQFISNIDYINTNYKTFNNFVEVIKSYKSSQSGIKSSINIKKCKSTKEVWRYEFCSSSGSIKDLLNPGFLDILFAEMAGVSVNRLRTSDLFEKVLSVIRFLKPEKEGKLLYAENMKKYKELFKT